MTFEEFMDATLAQQTLHPDWRWGQTCFNTLWSINPVLADHIRSTESDPFYSNDHVSAFLNMVYSYFDSFGSVEDERRNNSGYGWYSSERQ